MTAAAAPTREAGAGFLVVADDLTGALDTAGSLASADRPFVVPLRVSEVGGSSIAVDTDSRDLGQSEAVHRVAEAVRTRGRQDGQIVFKKIDSVMRGHPIAETVSAFRAGEFDRVLLAPAFPGLGRITRGGQQFVVTAEATTPVGPPLFQAVRSFGLEPVPLEDADGSASVVIADAENEAALQAALARIKELGGRTLFAGSAGLAMALRTRPAPFIGVPPLDVAICGTAHPVTRAQVERLVGSPVGILSLDGGEGHDHRYPAAYVAPEGAVPDVAARCTIQRSIEALTAVMPAPRTAFVTGGWTLRIVLNETRADSLLCLGLHTPGVPISVVMGGSWHGTRIVSKSGGFGGPDLLQKLFQRNPCQ